MEFRFRDELIKEWTYEVAKKIASVKQGDELRISSALRNELGKEKDCDLKKIL